MIAQRKAGRPKTWTDDIILEHGAALLDWFREDAGRIWLKDYALANDIPPDNLSKWARENDEFAEYMSMAKAIQESRLFHAGCHGTINTTMAIFTLKNNHGWTDRHEVTTDAAVVPRPISEETWQRYERALEKLRGPDGRYTSGKEGVRNGDKC